MIANKGTIKEFNSRSDWNKQLKGYVTNTGLPPTIRKYLKTDPSVFTCLNVEPVDQKAMPEAFVTVGESRVGRPDLATIPLFLNPVRWRASTVHSCSGGYCLELETAPADFNWDWKDLVIAVQPQPDRSVKITAVAAIFSPYSFNLYDADGQRLVYDFGPHIYNFTTTYTFPPPAAISYGVNPAAKWFTSEADGDKVLVTEYKRAVCSVLNSRTPVWPWAFRHKLEATDFWPRDAAPRHNGMLNVLFQNGVVKTLRPHDIDPRYPAKAKEYWLPKALTPESDK